MRVQMRGVLVEVTEHSAQMELGGVVYELLVPAAARDALRSLLGRGVTLHTVEYIEGGPGMGHMLPRLVGFLTAEDKAFFHELTRVKGVSVRKALRAMSLPTPQIAAAIQRANTALLTTLPEVGKRTAEQMVTELRERMTPYLHAPATEQETDVAGGAAANVALDILVRWGDRRADAQRWIDAALHAEPQLSEPDEIVRAAYRVKNAGG